MDIVERLRGYDENDLVLKTDMTEAADEIERLREELRVSRQSTTILIESLDKEIERLLENANQDAKFLSAYHRICQKHGIAPSSSDLIAAMKEDE